jgi:hypothetical protein
LIKTAYLASNKDFESFQWSWPGNHQPLHAIVIILNFLNDSPYSPMVQECRNVVDAVLASHKPIQSLVSPTESPMPSHPTSRTGSQIWKYLAQLRQKVWLATGVDETGLWSRDEAASYSKRIVEDLLTNQKLNETFEMDDPAHDLDVQSASVSRVERNLARAQTDTMLYGDDEDLFESFWSHIAALSSL